MRLATEKEQAMTINKRLLELYVALRAIFPEKTASELIAIARKAIALPKERAKE